jgi:hypothetical protein
VIIAVVAFLGLWLSGPKPRAVATRRAVTVWFGLAVLGLEVLRRQTAREFPDTEPKGLVATFRDIFGRRTAGTTKASDPAGEFERLALLRAEGALDGAEFAAAKAQILGAGPEE